MRCDLTRHLMLALVRVWYFGRWNVRRGGRREPQNMFVEHIPTKLELFEVAKLTRSLSTETSRRLDARVSPCMRCT